MGAFLKCSESMLVLWDRTYTHRLWCIFAPWKPFFSNCCALTSRAGCSLSFLNNSTTEGATKLPLNFRVPPPQPLNGAVRFSAQELSAYLHSRPDGAKHNLVVRPVLLGPCCLSEIWAFAKTGVFLFLTPQVD